ncbi:hypothetical protein [Plasmodium yoelii yoelii]|uniref:Uncharacterized protein n=1 Tax=Plasmodium yoelii yoelii TaxID=73239 RepID=Q7RSA0_PLAYO|nr:hypothetical protein [Plasmodium yoelii yoelii]
MKHYNFIRSIIKNIFLYANNWRQFYFALRRVISNKSNNGIYSGNRNNCKTFEDTL